MNWLDIVILAVAGFVALAGLRMGAVHLAVTGAGALAGIALASRFHDDLEPVFSPITDSANSAEIAAFVAIAIASLLASVVVGALARTLLKTLMLGWADKLAGLALAVVLVLAVASGLLSAVQSYPVLGLEETIQDSTLGTFLADHFDTVLRGLRIIPTDLGT